MSFFHFSGGPCMFPYFARYANLISSCAVNKPRRAMYGCGFTNPAMYENKLNSMKTAKRDHQS